MTGYTAQIENGNITTGKDFLKLCTRAFGIAMDMREKPLSVPTPTQFEPDPYYKQKYDKAVEVRNKWKQMTFDEAKQKIIEKYNTEITQAKKSLDLSMNTYIYNYLERDLNKELDISDNAVWKYINDMNASCEKNVGEAYEQWQEELKRTDEKNTWMQQFLESLDSLEHDDADRDAER